MKTPVLKTLMEYFLVLVCAGILAACSTNMQTAPHSSGDADEEQSLAKLDIVPKEHVVAYVNGTAISADCVRNQLELHDSVQEALGDCIEFELLAQEASRRGYWKHPEVLEAVQRGAVRVFIEDNYPYASAADLPDAVVERLWARERRRRYQHPELRRGALCMIELDSLSGTPATAGRAFLKKVATQIGDRVLQSKEELFEACYGDPTSAKRPYREFGLNEVKLVAVPLGDYERLQPWARELLFNDKAKVGRVVGPLDFGHRILAGVLLEISPAKNVAFADAERELREALYTDKVFENTRDELFFRWVEAIAEHYKIVRPSDEATQSLLELASIRSLSM